ncbi:Mg chelatase, subunit ChlI [Chthoniobacter flavus Ellin428]|uniref:Mg chelatase, subunit ChlI n=1 Tax=Chthoniobacter flavus Ellin428 TaxID=497964 RepID=B4D7Q2_9BACT|nr:YifB family Mg chelatase-like AAA ATPase [Chthoniobacter flavus]EDY17542.1 Mg chelatase, subunit ChlI [Chthoniobacter flavus Ellin428]TCO92425.1 magnesium chelatase family protein [Chthoniobacter flavus]
MLAKVYSAAVYGVDAFEVEIEVNGASGNGVIVVVGLPDVAVKESKDRVTTAIQNSGYRWPRGRTTINLAPADVKKEGPSFDLPIALAMVAVGAEMELLNAEQYCFVGELALTGQVRPVKGVLPVALEARRAGRRAIVVPIENAREAAMVDGIEVYGVHNLREAFEFLTGERTLTPIREDVTQFFAQHQNYDVDFADVRGQHHVKRAIEVAVAGNHNALFIGPPGSGKSMIAKRIPTIIPPMTLEEAIESTKIHSICGLLLDPTQSFVATRPFRSPHHTISDIALIGGGATPTPGEISVAHNGVLFLDELPEFRRQTLEVLRQPLEDARVTISRATGSLTFPADFMLIAAMNPCKCGYFSDPKRECRCSPNDVQRYRDRISGPLLDRIDIHVEVPAVQYQDISSKTPGESSASIRERIIKARDIQRERFAQNGNGKSKVRCNARMSAQLLKRHCTLEEAAEGMMKMAMTELNFSARAYDRILKVARTIADLADSENILAEHVGEAIQYRTLDRNLWA